MFDFFDGSISYIHRAQVEFLESVKKAVLSKDGETIELNRFEAEKMLELMVLSSEASRAIGEALETKFDLDKLIQLKKDGKEIRDKIDAVLKAWKKEAKEVSG